MIQHTTTFDGIKCGCEDFVLCRVTFQNVLSSYSLKSRSSWPSIANAHSNCMDVVQLGWEGGVCRSSIPVKPGTVGGLVEVH